MKTLSLSLFLCIGVCQLLSAQGIIGIRVGGGLSVIRTPQSIQHQQTPVGSYGASLCIQQGKKKFGTTMTIGFERKGTIYHGTYRTETMYFPYAIAAVQPTYAVTSRTKIGLGLYGAMLFNGVHESVFPTYPYYFKTFDAGVLASCTYSVGTIGRYMHQAEISYAHGLSNIESPMTVIPFSGRNARNSTLSLNWIISLSTLTMKK